MGVERLCDLLTEAEAAARLKLCERTLRAIRKRGQIRYVALTARKIAYRPEDCAEYIAARIRQDEPPCRSTNPPKAASGITTSSRNMVVVGITEARRRRNEHRVK